MTVGELPVGRTQRLHGLLLLSNARFSLTKAFLLLFSTKSQRADYSDREAAGSA